MPPRWILIALAAGWLAHAALAGDAPLRADGPAAKRAQALLASMTLAEKLGQMAQVDSAALGAGRDAASLGLGSVLSGGISDPEDNTPRSWARLVARFRADALATRLKIPLLYGIDAVHGHNNVVGAVIFPHNIGMGATRNPGLVERAARVTASEVAATGINWDFAPCLAVARDERWGRTYESFGEDPALVARMGAAVIRGLQGGALSRGSPVLACAKHFIGDGGTAGGKDQGDTRVSEAVLRRIHLPGYEAAIRAGVGSIMVSFNSWNGRKLHGSKALLDGLLKGELGFRGFLVSDWAAIDQLPGDYGSNIETAINAGLDMIMLPNGPDKPDNYRDFLRLLERSVRAGRIPMARIDDAVQRILTVKFAMSLEHRPASPGGGALKKIGSPAHRAVARDCVRQSLVLLRNENAILPLSKKTRKIVVTGKGANDLGVQCGGWTIDWQGGRGAVTTGGTTIFEGIRRAVARGADVVHSAGGENLAGADVAIVVVGEEPYAEFEGDTGDLSLDGADRAAIARCRAAGVPVVLVILSGRPLIITREIADCAALLAAWLPGSEGAGVADVLFGDYAPTGRLPISWPRAMNQIPINAGDANFDPLFPCDFGLSFSR